MSSPAISRPSVHPLDFVGLNVYTADYVQADASPRGYSIVPRPTSYPHLASPWIKVTPECTYWTIRNVTDLWHPKAHLHHGEWLLVRRRAQRRRRN